MTKSQLKDLDKQEQKETVHKINQAKNIRRKRDKPDRPVTKPFTANRNSGPCRYCGEIHKAGRDHCPVWGKFCFACGKRNHFACHCVSENTHQSSSESHYMGCVTVSNIVIATKPSGDLSICIDPKPLNKALKREKYPIPVIDDVLPELARAKMFTKIDAKNGYWHVALDDESAKLTTFDTPFGRYC